MGVSPALRPRKDYFCWREGYRRGISLFFRQPGKWFRRRAELFRRNPDRDTIVTVAPRFLTETPESMTGNRGAQFYCSTDPEVRNGRAIA
jgi:hypothetical protein